MNEVKVNTVKQLHEIIRIEYLEAPMLLLCYDCSRQTKSILEDKNKTNTFFWCMFTKFI